MSRLLTPLYPRRKQAEVSVEIIPGPDVLKELGGNGLWFGLGSLNSKGFHMLGQDVTVHARMNPDKSFSTFTTSTALSYLFMERKISDDLIIVQALQSLHYLRTVNGLTWESRPKTLPVSDTIMAAVGTENELFTVTRVSKQLLKSVNKGDTFSAVKDLSAYVEGEGIMIAGDGQHMVIAGFKETGDAAVKSFCLINGSSVSKIATAYSTHCADVCMAWPFVAVPCLQDAKILVTENGFSSSQWLDLPVKVTGNRPYHKLCGSGNTFMLIVPGFAKIFYTRDRFVTWAELNLPEAVNYGGHFAGDGTDFYFHNSRGASVCHFHFN
jgi:hypothetical protein